MIEKYVDSQELKRLLSTLLVLVGCLMIAALFGILVVPGLRNANKPPTPTAVSPVVGETGWLDPTEFPVQKGRVIPPVDPATLIKPSPELMDKGKVLYKENCQTCHGESGHGDGPAAGSMEPKPRNYTASSGWVNGRDMPGIYKTLQHGIPGSSMASFDYLTKKDRMALVHRVESLGGFADVTGSPEAMRALSEELAAPGEKTNNKIPVSMAIAKLASEYSPPPPLEMEWYGRLPETALLHRVVWDPSRVFQTLQASAVWRKNPASLAQSILPDTPANGFSTEVASLKPSEWQTMYDEFVKHLEAK